jgi:cytochrome c oxidase assembly protein subunit 15
MQKYFSILLYTTFFLALLVIVLGAYTRLSDAGLGCPDWPGCYGSMGVPDEIKTAQYQRPLESEKAWKEMIHRYAAGTLGILILLIFMLSIKYHQKIKQGVVLPFILLISVIFQALLGMWTVTHLLTPIIVTGHLLGGFTSLTLIYLLLLKQHPLRLNFSQKRTVSSRLQLFALFSLVLLLLQIFLGGWTSTNYAALACGNSFPTCFENWLPELNFSQAFNLTWQSGVDYEFGKLDSDARTTIHFTHRVGALLVFVSLGVLASKLLKYKLGFSPKLVLILLLIQVTLGILNVVLSLPLLIAVAHTLTAALLLLALITLNFRLYHYRNT